MTTVSYGMKVLKCMSLYSMLLYVVVRLAKMIDGACRCYQIGHSWINDADPTQFTRGVPIIGSTDILATNMAIFTTSVIGTTYS